MNFNMNPPTTNATKYKTMLCKHFETSKGCAFKEKCQFAHGYSELKTTSGFNSTSNSTNSNQSRMQTSSGSSEVKKGPNTQNFKIVKCKYWEKDGTCRYGTLCTFAHGDTELRTKTDNLILSQNQSGYIDMNGQIGNQVGSFGLMDYGIDPNMMPMFNPYAMQFDPMMMGQNLGIMGMPPQGFDQNLLLNPMMNPYAQPPYNKQQFGGQGNINFTPTNGNTNL